MYKIGIDIGSTYTKYCVADSENKIIDLFAEKTPTRQLEYFKNKLRTLEKKYPNCSVVSCGYGKKNIENIKNINELIALAKGAYNLMPVVNHILDIGGQDTKYISHENGYLKEFFINEKCAAGSGIFLSNICNILDKKIDTIELLPISEVNISLSSVCAVFAQSEIVKLVSENVDEDLIISSVVKQILNQAKALLGKMHKSKLLLSGGLTNIKGFKEYAEYLFDRECLVVNNASFFSAIGCTSFIE